MPTTTTTKPKTTSAKGRGSSAKRQPATKQAPAKKPMINKSVSTPNPVKVTNYATAQRWLYQHVDHEKLRFVTYDSQAFSLDRMRKLMAQMGNPHQQIKCVQIAGTKGKGSTCAMLSSVLRTCGYTVGLYTSPHLIDLRERIAIDGQVISHADFVEIAKTIASKEAVLGQNPPTFFELMTAIALCYFAEQAVDIVVLETGLGGRLDATTVVTPLVCGLTHISHDHMNLLGCELTDIAKEKAGIFKKDIPAVSVAQDPGVVEVFDQHAQEVGTPLEYTGNQIDFSYRFEACRDLGPHTRVCVNTPTSQWEHLPVPLRGEQQAHNCGLALAILDKLKVHDYVIPEDKVGVGLAATTLAGRMEQVRAEPQIIIDGAHNAVSIRALIRALGAHIGYDSLVMIFGTGHDKDIQGMLKQVALGADKVIFTKAKNNPRALEPQDLLTRFSELSAKMAQSATTLPEALRLAGCAVSRGDLIVVTGSFYLVGEAKKHFADLTNKPRGG